MTEELEAAGETKEERYRSLLPQVKGLTAGESDALANMANLCAAIKYGMGYFWVGFYLVKGEDLVLGPFQGPVACTRIRKGRGVCGKCWEQGEALIVEDVSRFPGHIACSQASKSEIVIPVRDRSGEIVGVLDVDHDLPGAFDLTDLKYLTEMLGAPGTLAPQGT